MGTVTIEKKRPVRRKKRISVKAILLVTILQLTIVMYLGCMMIFYGPFPTLRRYIVNTAMATYSHQYIAQAFLSNDQIQRIISEGTSTFDIEQNESGVTIKNSGSKNVEVYKINGSQYEGYMLVVSDPFRVKVGYSNQLGKQGQTTSAIAKENNAIAAINGGGFNDSADSGRLWAGTGANPTGFLISGGEIIFKDRSLGKNQKLSVMAMDENGKLIVGKHSINELMKRNVNEAITFGPALVINGKAAFRGDGGQGMNPRAAIGQRNDGS
ncbi:MAG: phosphodiester glycosidase family protein, partial [Clostridiales bacterium]|nr:phosphodiester glycosidase family protein [Clostridiales bacterium]